MRHCRANPTFVVPLAAALLALAHGSPAAELCLAPDAKLRLDATGIGQEINVCSYDWSFVPATTPGPPGRVSVSDFKLTKYVDGASPKLFQACATGNRIGEVELLLARAASDKDKLLEYKFTNAVVTGFQGGAGSRGGDPVPTESVSFSFETIEITYMKQDKNGKPTGEVSVKYDLDCTGTYPECRTP